MPGKAARERVPQHGRRTPVPQDDETAGRFAERQAIAREALREDRTEVPVDAREPEDDALEVALAEHQHIEITSRAHGGDGRTAGEERQLADRGAGARST